MFGISRVRRELLSWYRMSPLVLAGLNVAILLKLTLHLYPLAGLAGG